MRKSFALAAAGVIAGSMFAVTSASAQTATIPAVTPNSNNNRNINVRVDVKGPVPSAVGSIGVIVRCVRLQGTPEIPSQSLSAGFPTSNASATSSFTFGLQATTACRFYAVQQTATSPVTQLPNGAAVIDINVGGSSRTAAAPTAADVTSFAGGMTAGAGSVTSEIAVVSGTDVIITVSYPQVTVRKVVQGTEPTPGFDYPMVVTCNTVRSSAVHGRTLPSTGRPAGDSAPFDGDLVTPAGAGNFITVTLPAPTAGGVPAGTYNFYDYRSAAQTSPNVVHTAEVFASLPANQQAVILGALSSAPAQASAPVSFTLKGGASRVIGANDVAGLTAANTCSVTELNANGANLVYQFLSGAAGSTTGFGNTVLANGGTLTVTNAFTGDLIVSKVVTGDPRTNVAIYEVSVACDQGGPRETFLLKDRQSRVYRGIAAGTNCLVTETRSDGATATYADNSGENTTDGRVVIRQTQQGCIDPNLSTTSGSALATAKPDCVASVIITNSYTTTTVAPSTTAAAAAAPATAAPAVAPAPAEPVVEAPTFTG
jgi:hypothetical protein